MWPVAAVHSIDAELEAVLKSQKAKIKVVGTGGGGNNTINRISEVGIVGVQTVAINTDAQDLLYTTADKKILIGKELTGGLEDNANTPNQSRNLERNVWIYNPNGSKTKVTLRLTEDGWCAPKNDCYERLPTANQLRDLYAPR